MRFRPLSQAGAWGLFDRAVAEKLKLDKMQTQELIDAALTMYGSIAAPVLCVTGILGGDARRLLLRQLDASGLQARRELLLVASAVAGNSACEIEDPLLTKLANRGENLPSEGSTDAVEDDLSRWSMGSIPPMTWRAPRPGSHPHTTSCPSPNRILIHESTSFPKGFAS